METLKRKVEVNPIIERIKEQIKENQNSTEWNLHLDIEKIKAKDNENYDKILEQILSSDKKENQLTAFKQN